MQVHRHHRRFGSSAGFPYAPAAQATKQVSVEGEDLEAFEILLYLEVIALKGSVPTAWEEDFKQVLKRSPLCPACSSDQHIGSKQLDPLLAGARSVWGAQAIPERTAERDLSRAW